MTDQVLSRKEEAAALNQAMRERFDELAERLIGDKPTDTRGDIWRWGGHGSLAISVRGPNKGSWFDHEADKGGGPVDLIHHLNGGTIKQAMDYARQFTGITQGKILPPPRARDPEEGERRAALMAEKAAERIAYSRKLWAASSPLPGTVAERYLTETRGIPAPAAGWPDALRFHAPTNSLIVAATNDRGDLMAVQRVHLTNEARKIQDGLARPQKQSFGVRDETTYTRLPGPSAGPLVYAEGPENGLSVWAATGHETHIRLGGLQIASPPRDRPVVLARDDDPIGSKADVKLNETIERLRADGVQLSVVTPWPERRGDKSDMNDTIRQDGPEGVRERFSELQRDAAFSRDEALTRLFGGISAEIAKQTPEITPASRDGRILYQVLAEKIDREVAGELGEDAAKQMKDVALKAILAREERDGPIVLGANQQIMLAPPDVLAIREKQAEAFVERVKERLEAAHSSGEVSRILSTRNVMGGRERLDQSYPELADSLDTAISDAKERVREEEQDRKHDREAMPSPYRSRGR